MESPSEHPYLHEYPEELRLAKLETVTKALEEVVGSRPTSYRGGRWSMDAFTMRSLDDMGYIADTTVTPFVSWVTEPGTTGGGPNFAAAPHLPYHPSGDDPISPGHLRILEVPPSFRPSGIIPDRLYWTLGARIGDNPRAWRLALRYFLNRLGRAIEPNPAVTSAGKLKWLARRVGRERPPILNLELHSSEMMAGGAPWVTSADDERQLRRRIRSLCEVVSKSSRPWVGSTLSALGKALSAAQHKMV